MLAVTTTDALSIVDPATLKRAPSSLPSCLPLVARPTASVWSVDNASVFLSSPHVMHKYDPSSNRLKDIHSIEGPDTMTHLVAKDKATIIFNEAHKVHVFECGSTSGPTKLSQTFESHKTAITSLSLSNDSTLLASTSAGAAHVHNLTLGSHTVLRGLTLAGQSISTSAFHLHSRTRLLLGIGKQIVVYDTTRPSGPIKTIPMTEANSGEITAIACSPFSKTLVALATSGGYVGLVDLDKEKSLFRTLNLKVPLTAIAFSPEGAAIYVGTEHGKLLITDLRALDKPPKTIVISEGGSRIETMSVQKKVKGAEPSNKSTAASATANPTTVKSSQPDTTKLVPRSSSNAAAPAGRAVPKVAIQVAPSPGRARVSANNARSGPPSAVTSPAARRTASALSKGSVVASPRTRTGAGVTEGKGKRTVFSPVRDPLGNSGGIGDGDISVQIESLIARSGAKKESMAAKAATTSLTNGVKGKGRTSHTQHPASPKGGVDPIASISAPGVRSHRIAKEIKDIDPHVPRRARTLSSTSRTRKSSNTETGSALAAARLAVPGDSASLTQRARTRTMSSASRVDLESEAFGSSRGVSSTSVSARSGSPESRPGSSISRPGSSISRAGGGSPIPPVPALPDRYQLRETGGGIENGSRTPSPDLPDMNMDVGPMTPVPAGKKRGGVGMEMGVLGLGTPEIDRWIEAGKAKGRDGKSKGKTVGFMEQKDDMEEESEEGNGGEDGEIRREVERERERNMAMQISPRRPNGVGSSKSWAPSPLRQAIPASPGGSAHDLLRTIVQDVMYDFRRETKAEMTGLHLDLVRMGRGWKKELRGLMEEYVGDLRDLREENRVLREENERLRRGY